MTNLEFGITGAKRTSIEKDDPIKLLWEIREAFPTAGPGELLRKFTDAAKDDPEMLDVIIAYCFANLQHRIEHPRHPRKSTKGSKMMSQISGRLDRHIAEKATAMLADMMMPNGKRLGNCTIAYCSKLGGWMSRLAKGQNPRKTVDMVYDEADLLRLRKG